ncbi:MAG: helix-turn-helix transcriptional regulator [Clostridia bacterium]|nr:helix-turn-helix transcriptional regulator [Clostridia bacterium]
MANLEKEVKKALIDHEMTMGDLANELGISISYVSDLIKGKRTNDGQIKRIVCRLGLTLSEITENCET